MPVDEPHRVTCRLDVLRDERGMTLVALAEQIGVTVVSTLTALCDALNCQPGDLFTLDSR